MCSDLERTRENEIPDNKPRQDRIQQLEAEARRQAAEIESLRQSHAVLTQIIHNVPQAIFWKDLRSVFQGCNEVFARTQGYPDTAHVVGKTDYELSVPAEDARAYTADDHEVMTSGKPKRHIIEPVQQPDGTRLWVDTTKIPLIDDAGRVAGVLGVYEDVTDRIRAETALRESRRMLQLVLDTIPVRVFWKNRDSVLLGCNRLFAEDAGVSSPDEILGKTDYEMGWRDQAEIYRADDRQVMEAGIPKLGYEEPQTTPLGDLIWLRTSKIPLRDEAGQVIGVLGTYEDITAWKNSQEERRQLESQLQHAQKLESLGVLAGGIAHDFNNLLMAIMGNAELALTPANDLATVRSHVLEISRASRRAAELCQQMLAYSGRGHFVIEAVSLNDLVLDMTQMLEVSIAKKAELQLTLAENLPAVEADTTQIRQILMNLITNAAEAVGDRNGTIAISTGIVHCDRNFFRQTYFTENLPEGRYVYLDVADNGCGMTPEVRARIFDPFFTTKFTGRGLGLAAVLGIVRGHRGAIRVESEPERGTSIRVFFPPSQSARIFESPSAQEIPAHWSGSGLVLLVEDEEIVRDIARQMLEAIGFEVVVAADGGEAIEAIERHHGSLRAVLLDYTMPRMDGEETFRVMHRRHPQIPVILSSGYSEQDLTERFSDRGLSGFIQKPYQLDSLREVFRWVLGGREPAGGR
jgi:two-component system cell cycle sensor histidine kinase/response regulator CckA